MRIYITHPLNRDRLFAYDNATVTKNSCTYQDGPYISTWWNVQEGVHWHADQVSAARRLMLNRKTEIDRLETEADRLKALPNAVEQALDDVISEARAA